jgi:hypothetical protein
MNWFGPSGDCGCCDSGPCCNGELCLALDLTVGTTDCCDIGNHVIAHSTATTESSYCVFKIDIDDYPPGLGSFPADPVGVYWLQEYKSSSPPTFPACEDLVVDVCYSEVSGSITYNWYPYYIQSEIKTSTTNGHVTITIIIGYIGHSYNSSTEICAHFAAGTVVYTFESNNCLAGPFQLTDTVVNPSGFRSWVPPECDIEINDVYECV